MRPDWPTGGPYTRRGGNPTYFVQSNATWGRMLPVPTLEIPRFPNGFCSALWHVNCTRFGQTGVSPKPQDPGARR